MAKKRKLEAPSAADLDRIEKEFRRETSSRSITSMAPIAEVAADAARSAPVMSADIRAKIAKDNRDAKAYRQAEADGHLIREIPLSEINADDMVRDRASLGEEEMTELRLSISANGLRLPIEVYPLASPDGEMRYGLLSGYRRLKAFSGLLALTGDKKYDRIAALVKEPASVPEAFASMIEENEIRVGLSHFERGRIASIAVQTGVFASVEESVNALFRSASKAKRSKVRSFAAIYQELGDVLAHPDGLTEKQGLRLTSALRAGAEAELRNKLETTTTGNAAEEWAVLEPVVAGFEDNARDPTRGGRPKVRKSHGVATHTDSGFVIRREEDTRGHLIRIEGRRVDAELVDALILEIQHLLEKP